MAAARSKAPGNSSVRGSLEATVHGVVLRFLCPGPRFITDASPILAQNPDFVDVLPEIPSESGKMPGFSSGRPVVIGNN
jgi:hypothetical protein